MANLIQIKRSLNTAVPGSLANGELAYTANGDILYIGSNGNVEAIAGKRTPGTLTANQALVANSTSGIDKVIVANLQPSYIYANGASGTGGQYLTSNSTGGVHWSDPTSGVAGSDTQVQFNDDGSLAGDAGLTYNKTTDTLTAVNFSGNGALVTSVDAASVGGNTATDLRNYSDTIAGTAYSNAMSDTLSRNGTYTGNNTLAGTTTTVSSNLVLSGLASSNVIPSANLTYHLGNTTNRWAQVHAGNGHFVTGTFDSDVQIAGDLTVTGNVTTTNVNDLIVGDPLIHLAANNETSDVVDIGFIGHYSDDGGTTKKHIGFFRDASDGGVFKIFEGSQETALDTANTVVVNVNATGYTTAILETYLRSSGLVSNSSVVNITANSSVSVTLTANTLTLTTALVGTSGGTGKSTMTNNAILVGNSTNGYNELALGTSGYVLQSNGTALVYDTLDGGTF